MDTPTIMGTIPLEFRFFAKEGLFSIPFLGWHLRHAGHLPVVRDDPRASIKTMSQGAKLIRERGISVLIFPEGGRSEVQIRPFKEGAAYIAIKAGVPVVPIGLVGTRNALPMHSMLVRGGKVRLLVGDPIETAGLTLHDRGRLNLQLQEQVAALIGERVIGETVCPE
jgi:1-acyl-sn-glycerol-3-phosphate acyltransferase